MSSCFSVNAAEDLSVKEILAKSGFKGGLVVQAGIDNASLAAEFGRMTNVVYQGLALDGETLRKVRTKINDAGAYGRSSAIIWDGKALPYADGMVNLFLCAGNLDLDKAEVDRVLAPLGTALVIRDGAVSVHRKPWPEEVDVWTHSRRDSTGNAVSSDRLVGPPRYTQWEAHPRWNHGTKTSAMVSEGGRIYYILADSHFATSSRVWSLIARDAFNGIELWRHELPAWEGAKGGKKVGPAQVNRRLVAVNGRVYAPLKINREICVMDAATGRVLRVLKQTAKCEEFLVSGGVLVALLNESGDVRFWTRLNRKMSIVAFDPEDGKLLWRHSAGKVLPMTLTADNKRVVYHNGTSICSLDLHSGVEQWLSAPTGQKLELMKSHSPDKPGAAENTIFLAPQLAPTMVIYNGVVAFAGGKHINVYSVEDGSELWNAPYASSNYSTPVDLFGFNGALWGPNIEMNLWRPLDDDLGFKGYNPMTGKVQKEVVGHYNYRFQHHRCYQMKAVGNTVLGSRAGIEFLDTETGHLDAHHWIRGSCYYGVLPANGQIYVPPHNCACYIRAKLSGLMSVRSSSARALPIPDAERLQKGSAYGKLKLAGTGGKGDWPTYRHDSKRTGRSEASIGDEMLLGWSTRLPSPLTSPVVAGGRVFIASTEAHRLSCLDSESGKVVWERTLGGRIDSPPTVYMGIVLCGCRDGSVYAFRSVDGALVWRFRAAPENKNIMSRGQLESIWPVFGSVLVVNDTALFAAGKTSYMDGGIRLYGLNVFTGAMQFSKVFYSRDNKGVQTLDAESVDGYLNDILSCDGERVFMRHQALDLQGNPKPGRVTHLHSPDGYLSSDTTTRLLWTYAPSYTSPHQGAFYDLRLSRSLFPSGRIMVEGEDTIYGFGQNHYKKMQVVPGGQFALFAAAKESDVPLDLTAKEYRKLALSGKGQVNFKWWKTIPIYAWALAKSSDVLFVGGARGRSYVTPDALAGDEEGGLLAVSPDDGRIISDMTLPAMPVWDGLAIADNSLFASLANGEVVRLWSLKSGRKGDPLSAETRLKLLPPVKIEKEDGLLGCWRFDEGAGTLARDSSGRGHDAQVQGRWVADGPDKVIETRGRSGSVVIPDASHLQFGNNDFTLSLWLKVENYDARLIGKENFPDNWWVINLTKSGSLELVLGEGRGAGKSMRARTSGTMVKGEWNHIVVSVDRKAGRVIWFVNGNEDSSSPIPKTMKKGMSVVGADISIPSRHKPFKGMIGDFRIYGESLGAERVKKIFSDGR